MKNITLILIALLILTACQRGSRYSTDECLKFKKGDTIYVSYSIEIQKAKVLSNDTVKQILELKRVGAFTELKSYDDVRFK